MEEIIGKLNILLANLYVQRANIQAVHWNLRGCHAFLTFHNYFGELYDYNSTHIDMIAEFIRIYKYNPIHSLATFLETASIEEIEHEDTLDIDKAIEKSIDDNNIIISALSELFDATTSELDIGDYMATMQSDFGKRNWFLRSSMKKKSQEVENENLGGQEEQISPI